MGAPMVVPFDNNPVAVSVKTASYTIPAGKFARVHVECENGGIFTINAVNAVVTAAFLNIDVLSTAVTPYTVPTGYLAEFIQARSINGTMGFNGNGLDYGVNIDVRGKLGPAGTVNIQAGGYTSHISGVAIPGNATHRTADLYLPAGTIINGSGTWRAIVQEYNVIS